MKRYTKVLLSMLTLTIAGLGTAGATHALTFSQDIGVSFTFNPSLVLTLSSGDLTVSNLAPGTALDSNIITVNVMTNNINGYTLTATVGNDSTYNTRNLVHTNSSITNNFASLDYGASVADLTSFSDNTWGYSYLDESLNNGTNTTWTNYSGLPLYSDTTNVATIKSSSTPPAEATGDNIQFKIGAKASSSQLSGEYNNTVNFTLVATTAPATLYDSYASAGKEKLNGYYKLQDMSAEICNNAEVLDEGSQMQAIDVRDNKVYWITKLQDGKCWFTQNLDHDIVTTPGYYTHDNTDLGWGSDTATTSWTPVRATIDASNVTNNSIPNWTDDKNTPYSVDPGNVYWNSTPFYASTANLFLNNDWGSDPVKFQKDTPFAGNGTHGHVGNYYNWSAAVAMNDTSSYTASTYADISGNPQNSICPAGWRLPTVTSASPTYAEDGSKNEFARLANLYANYAGSINVSSEGLEAAPLYFVRAGSVISSRQYYSGYFGRYWSSTVGNRSDMSAYHLDLRSLSINSQITNGRNGGFSLRCVSR